MRLNTTLLKIPGNLNDSDFPETACMQELLALQGQWLYFNKPY
jgi:hypothetical protein